MGKIKKPKSIVPGLRPTAMKSSGSAGYVVAPEKHKEKKAAAAGKPTVTKPPAYALSAPLPKTSATAAAAAPPSRPKAPTTSDPMALARKLQQQRDVARAAQDWAKADSLRDQIQKLGVKVQDSKVGDGGGSKIVLTKKAALEVKVAKKERQAVAAGKPLKATKSAEDEEGDSDDEEEEDDEDDESGSEEEDYLSGEEEEEEEEEEKEVRAPPPGAERTLAMGVRVADLEVGRGPPVPPRAPVRVRYVGKLASTGAVFDATKGKPFCFRLGRGEVIKGWDLGVAGMRKGGTRLITCPPGAGYGAQGTPGIPPNSTLVFEVTVV